MSSSTALLSKATAAPSCSLILVLFLVLVLILDPTLGLGLGLILFLGLGLLGQLGLLVLSVGVLYFITLVTLCLLHTMTSFPPLSPP